MVNESTTQKPLQQRISDTLAIVIPEILIMLGLLLILSAAILFLAAAAGLVVTHFAIPLTIVGGAMMLHGSLKKLDNSKYKEYGWFASIFLVGLAGALGAGLPFLYLGMELTTTLIAAIAGTTVAGILGFHVIVNTEPNHFNPVKKAKSPSEDDNKESYNSLVSNLGVKKAVAEQGNLQVGLVDLVKSKIKEGSEISKTQYQTIAQLIENKSYTLAFFYAVNLLDVNLVQMFLDKSADLKLETNHIFEDSMTALDYLKEKKSNANNKIDKQIITEIENLLINSGAKYYSDLTVNSKPEPDKVNSSVNAI